MSELHSEVKLETETIFDEEAAAKNLFQQVRPKRAQKKSLKLLEAEESEHDMKIPKDEINEENRGKNSKIQKDKSDIDLEDHDNPWDIRSIYEFQYFNCPKCRYSHNSKQDFINHAYENHPEAIENFDNIIDGSLNDVICPWKETEFIKTEPELKLAFKDENIISNVVAENVFRCYFCSEPFPSGAALSKHRLECKLIPRKTDKQGNIYYNCNVCKKKLTRISSLELHIKRVHKKMDNNPSSVGTKKICKCYFCSKVFATTLELYEHRRTHQKQAEDGKMYYDCNDCDKKFDKVSGLKNHVHRVHTSVRQCVECNATFADKATLLIHMNMSHEKYKCDQCDKECATEKLLNTHKKQIHEGKKFACEKCDKVYGASSHLKKHVQMTHEDKSLCQIHKCDQCDKKYDAKAQLRFHKETVHEGKKDHVCETCGKAFGRKGHLSLHIKSVHEGLNKCQCNVCGKNFTEEASLRRHFSVIHEGEKKFNCTECAKSFGQKHHLSDHIKRVHEGIKDNICGLCNKAFITTSKLKHHIKMKHERIKVKKTHACEDCGKVFPKPSRLKRHVNIIHKGIKEFQCLLCDKAYGQKCELIKHNQRIHGETDWTEKSPAAILVQRKKIVRKQEYYY